MTDDQLRRMFGYVAPTERQAKSCVTLRTSFWHLARLVVANSEPGHARAVAIATLQQASWAAMAAVVDDGG